MPDNSNGHAAAARGPDQIPAPPAPQRDSSRPSNPLFAFFNKTLKSDTYRSLLKSTSPDAD